MARVFPILCWKQWGLLYQSLQHPLGQIPEVIENGKEGFIVELGDVESLKKKIQQLAQNPLLRRKWVLRVIRQPWRNTKSTRCFLDLIVCGIRLSTFARYVQGQIQKFFLSSLSTCTCAILEPSSIMPKMALLGRNMGRKNEHDNL